MIFDMEGIYWLLVWPSTSLIWQQSVSFLFGATNMGVSHGNTSYQVSINPGPPSQSRSAMSEYWTIINWILIYMHYMLVFIDACLKLCTRLFQCTPSWPSILPQLAHPKCCCLCPNVFHLVLLSLTCSVTCIALPVMSQFPILDHPSTTDSVFSYQVPLFRNSPPKLVSVQLCFFFSPTFSKCHSYQILSDNVLVKCLGISCNLSGIMLQLRYCWWILY